VDTVKEEFGCLECFSPLTTHLARPKRAFYLCLRQKREFAEEILTPLEFKKGR
jgi:hypothetical protein